MVWYVDERDTVKSCDDNTNRGVFFYSIIFFALQAFDTLAERGEIKEKWQKCFQDLGGSKQVRDSVIRIYHLHISFPCTFPLCNARKVVLTIPKSSIHNQVRA